MCNISAIFTGDVPKVLYFVDGFHNFPHIVKIHGSKNSNKSHTDHRYAMLLFSRHVHSSNSGLRSQKLRGLALQTINTWECWNGSKLCSQICPKDGWIGWWHAVKNQEKKMGPLVPHCWPRPCAASVLLLEPGVLMLGQPDVLCAKWYGLLCVQYSFTLWQYPL